MYVKLLSIWILRLKSTCKKSKFIGVRVDFYHVEYVASMIYGSALCLKIVYLGLLMENNMTYIKP